MEAAVAVARSGLGGGGCSGVFVQLRVRDRVRLMRMRRPVSGVASSDRRSLLVASLPAADADGTPSLSGSVASLSLSEAAVVEEAVESTASTEVLLPDILAKTVHVRFLLQKECVFGQCFLLVGDDPALGLWDPTKAIALDWSEGHVWMVEIDLPANKLIEFKFLLRDSLGKVRWQDGPNRTLQTSETSNTLVVYEDWDDAENQKISEEGELAIGMEEVIFSDVDISGNGATLVDGLQMGKNQETQDASSVEEALGGMDDEKKPTIADGNTVLIPGLQTSAVAADASHPMKSVEANEANTPQLILDTAPELPNYPPKEANIVPEDGDAAAAAADDDDYTERATDGSVLSEEDLAIENGSVGIVENDVLWGYKSLQRFLMSLGFKMDPTETT